ncbi:hypothetical protein LINPERHAP2_LOCUS26917 [Linum perenne]
MEHVLVYGVLLGSEITTIYMLIPLVTRTWMGYGCVIYLFLASENGMLSLFTHFLTLEMLRKF